MYGMEEQVVRQKRRDICEELREARLARQAHTDGTKYRIRAFLISALHVHHTEERGA